MNDFVITKDRLNKPIPSMTAENEAYKLRWFYDGDYESDKKEGKIRNTSIVVNLTPKNEGGLNIIYVPIDNQAVIQVPSGEILSNEIDSFRVSLNIAKEAADKAVAFMQQYISQI